MTEFKQLWRMMGIVLVALFVTRMSMAQTKIILVDADTTGIGADTLIVQFIEDSLNDSSGDPFVVERMEDNVAHAHRTDQPWWDSVNAEAVIWCASSFGGYHIADISVPVLTFNRSQQSTYGLGSGNLNSAPGMKLLNQHNHWITQHYPGDTLFPVHSNNVTFRQALGATANDLASITRTPGSDGPDTAVVVTVDSGGTLYNGSDTAPQRRAYIGIENPELFTWAHGWRTLFTRALYWLLSDTSNSSVRNEARICDHFLASTWFEVGSCDNATISGGATIRPGYDNAHVGALIRFDSLVGYLPTHPAGSTLVIDSASLRMYLGTSNAYNIQGADSSFDYRLYVAPIRRTVEFNEGQSTYDGTTCGESDTASATNHWVNRFTPAYPGDSASAWGDGSSLSDSSWAQEGARDTLYDIHPWRSMDTVRVNTTTTPPDSWTRFPIDPQWIQGIYDGGMNLGLAIGQAELYDTSNCELNYRGRAELPVTDNAPRLTIWWRFEPVSEPKSSPRRRIIQQVWSVNSDTLNNWGFTYDGFGSWTSEMIAYTDTSDRGSEEWDVILHSIRDRFDLNHDSRANIGDITELISVLYDKKRRDEIERWVRIE